jgi:ferredoxin-type protein NapF
MDSPIDRGRRAFLGLRAEPADRAIRPPWSSAGSIAEHCTGCGDCVAACPEHILIADRNGKPEVDFDRGGCTFCGACADSCAAPVFRRDQAPAWRVTVTISERCLPRRGILCESCRDACAESAIRFTRAAGHAPVPEVALQRCTGCGACVSICPERAISATTIATAAAHG